MATACGTPACFPLLSSTLCLAGTAWAWHCRAGWWRGGPGSEAQIRPNLGLQWYLAAEAFPRFRWARVREDRDTGHAGLRGGAGRTSALVHLLSIHLPPNPRQVTVRLCVCRAALRPAIQRRAALSHPAVACAGVPAMAHVPVLRCACTPPRRPGNGGALRREADSLRGLKLCSLEPGASVRTRPLVQRFCPAVNSRALPHLRRP